MATDTDPRPLAALEAVRQAGRRALGAGPVTLARMGGSSIATPGAAGWVTDFLNAAYYARPAAQRDVDDLRLAQSVLTTSWHRLGRRLRLADLGSFHRAFGADRLRGRGTLARAQLLEGADRLLSPGFARGYGDHSLRGWGVVFRDDRERERFDPGRRLADAPVHELSPPLRPAEEQTWHTYPVVPLRSASAAVALLERTERWPDFGCALGRFTPLRRGGLAGQTFEVEVAAAVTPRTPVFTRAYVTATRVLGRGAELDAYARELDARIACLPAGARPYAAVELTTHRGHFLGRGVSRLLVCEQGGAAWIRDVGSWDPLPPHLAIPYRLGGAQAQDQFWGGGEPERSMLHQFARLA